MNESIFVPIFEKEGNKFFILTEEFIGKDKLEATQIGIGAMLVECIICGVTYISEVREIDPKNTPHLVAKLGPLPVAIISGPIFDEETIRIEALEDTEP